MSWPIGPSVSGPTLTRPLGAVALIEQLPIAYANPPLPMKRGETGVSGRQVTANDPPVPPPVPPPPGPPSAGGGFVLLVEHPSGARISERVMVPIVLRIVERC